MEINHDLKRVWKSFSYLICTLKRFWDKSVHRLPLTSVVSYPICLWRMISGQPLSLLSRQVPSNLIHMIPRLWEPRWIPWSLEELTLLRESSSLRHLTWSFSNSGLQSSPANTRTLAWHLWRNMEVTSTDNDEITYTLQTSRLAQSGRVNYKSSTFNFCPATNGHICNSTKLTKRQ